MSKPLLSSSIYNVKDTVLENFLQTESSLWAMFNRVHITFNA